MALYRVMFFYPVNSDPKFRSGRTETCGSIRAAELAANSFLAQYPTVTTNDTYHRDVARGASVSVHRLRRKTLRAGSMKRSFWEKEQQVADILAPVYVVPSVGELGYTP